MSGLWVSVGVALGWFVAVLGFFCVFCFRVCFVAFLRWIVVFLFGFYCLRAVLFYFLVSGFSVVGGFFFDRFGGFLCVCWGGVFLSVGGWWILVWIHVGFFFFLFNLGFCCCCACVSVDSVVVLMVFLCCFCWFCRFLFFWRWCFFFFLCGGFSFFVLGCAPFRVFVCCWGFSFFSVGWLF